MKTSKPNLDALWRKDIKYHLKDMNTKARILKKDISTIESKRVKLTEREKEIISRIANVLKMLDYDLIRTNELSLIDKRKDLEMYNRLTIKDKELLR